MSGASVTLQQRQNRAGGGQDHLGKRLEPVVDVKGYQTDRIVLRNKFYQCHIVLQALVLALSNVTPHDGPCMLYSTVLSR